ncbi:MAG TPA: class I SAM-dependent methyltransferase [Acidobacteriota bacterium]|nr:class I SAM-dependent methyltransferase [Acidobacteriota bacterium]
MSNMAWPLACPECRNPVGSSDCLQDRLDCSQCGCALIRSQGIWDAFAPGRQQAFRPFLDDYTRIRKAEGRGSDSPDYYLNLPECPREHPVAWQWKIRRATYRKLLAGEVPCWKPGARVLDLGAGVGWLSHRLAQMGFRPCAVDLSRDDEDGLGAARHYRPRWPRMCAEFDRLPLADGVADVAVFNASLHYSGDYKRTLGEALRTLSGGGRLVVLETPVYRKEASGREMAAQRHADFQKRYGTASDALPSIEFLTWDWIAELGRDLGLKWQILRPFYGLKWHLRPFKARIKGTREPSQFVILSAPAP